MLLNNQVYGTLSHTLNSDTGLMIITVNGEMVENEAVIDYDGLVRNKSQILF